jgi:hypothetical protein
MAGYNGNGREESGYEILDRLRRLRAEHPDATFNEMVELVAADRIRRRRRQLMLNFERIISMTSFLDAMQARVVGTGFKCAIPDCDSCARYDGPDMNEVDAVLEALEKLS